MKRSVPLFLYDCSLYCTCACIIAKIRTLANKQKYSFEGSQNQESIREMALQLVKDSFLQQEKTILVAIDVAVEKMEKLSMINMLCHHFVAACSSLNDNWLEKLHGVLGKEAVDALEALVSCQKSYNQLMGYTTSDSIKDLVKREELKKDLIGKLKTNQEKRKFLKEILTKAKMWPTLMIDGSSSQDTTVDDDEKIAGVSLHSSVVGLLRTALESKYRKYVRHCFKELDVESLINILYLLIPPLSTPEHYERNNFLTDEPEMSQLLSIPPKDSLSQRQIKTFREGDNYSTLEESLHLMSRYDEETVIKCDGKLQGMDLENYQVLEIFDKVVPRSQHLESREGLLSVAAMYDAFRRTMYSSSYDDYFPNTERTTLTLNKEHQGRAIEAELIKSYKIFANMLPVTQKTEDINQLITDKLITDIHKMPASIQCNKGVDNLRHALYAYRSLVLSMFASGHTKSGTGRYSFSNMTIELKILTVREAKLKGILKRNIIAQKELQESWHEKILDWQRQVEDARRLADKHLRNCVTSYVTSEISLGKTRTEDLSTFHQDLSTKQDSLLGTQIFVKKSVKSLRARRHYLEASLESLIRQYDSTMLKYQARINEFSVEEVANNQEIERLQNKFKKIEEKYDEMRAMKRLKQLLQNMEKAEAIKQNWAARKIQVAWRKYKVAKLRKKKLKGRKRGKKKTPSPGKGSSPPAKSSTPGSRSKSQTP